ncbi:hypothetical protein LguiB_028496 [Lonicera macranthoides]
MGLQTFIEPKMVFVNARQSGSTFWRENLTNHPALGSGPGHQPGPPVRTHSNDTAPNLNTFEPQYTVSATLVDLSQQKTEIIDIDDEISPFGLQSMNETSATGFINPGSIDLWANIPSQRLLIWPEPQPLMSRGTMFHPRKLAQYTPRPHGLVKYKDQLPIKLLQDPRELPPGYAIITLAYTNDSSSNEDESSISSLSKNENQYPSITSLEVINEHCLSVKPLVTPLVKMMVLKHTELALSLAMTQCRQPSLPRKQLVSLCRKVGVEDFDFVDGGLVSDEGERQRHGTKSEKSEDKMRFFQNHPTIEMIGATGALVIKSSSDNDRKPPSAASPINGGKKVVIKSADMKDDM